MTQHPIKADKKCFNCVKVCADFSLPKRPTSSINNWDNAIFGKYPTSAYYFYERRLVDKLLNSTFLFRRFGNWKKEKENENGCGKIRH